MTPAAMSESRKPSLFLISDLREGSERNAGLTQYGTVSIFPGFTEANGAETLFEQATADLTTSLFRRWEISIFSAPFSKSR